MNPATLNIPYPDRPMHVYVPGKTRHGKTTLLFWMAYQDIKKGHGVCVIDAKGDLVRMLLDYLPAHRADDTLWLDLDQPVALDFMGYHGEREKERLIGELQFLLTKTGEPQHAPMMNANIKNVLYTLLDFNENPKTPSHRRTTFLDIYRFLEHEGRRNEILSGVRDTELITKWRNDFPNPVERSRITSRMTAYVRSKSLTRIFDAPEPRLNLIQAMAEKKVLLVNIGGVDDVQRAYGTLIVSKLRDAAYQRMNQRPPYTPYYLYCDEFQNFQTSDFAEMLSMSGGLGLCLTLAHQFVQQLESQVLASIKGNVSSFVIFRLGAESAAALKHEIDPPDRIRGQTTFSDYLATLAVGVALYRDARGKSQWVYTPRPPHMTPNFEPSGYAEYIKKRTVEQYSSPTLQIFYTEMNVRADRAVEDQTDYKIEPGPEPRVPPFQGKTKRPRPPR
jgi:hypothetical protein